MSLVDSGANHVVRSHGQDQFPFGGDLSGPGRLGTFSFLQSLIAADLTVGLPARKTRAGTSVHRALVELLPHSEGDVGGSDGGGGFDGQRLAVLCDLHQRFGRRLHRDLTQHHVHAQSFQEFLEVFRALHLPSAGEVWDFALHVWYFAG